MDVFTNINTDIKSYLTFKLGNDTFACHVNKLLYILEIPQITEVPDAPDYMRGIIDLKGDVLPVVDVQIKLNKPPIEFTKDTCIVVMNTHIETDNILLGVLVDSVVEVVEFEADVIRSAPSLGERYNSEFITGIVKNDDGFVMILDIDKIFSSEKLNFLVNNDVLEDDDENEDDENEDDETEEKEESADDELEEESADEIKV